MSDIPNCCKYCGESSFSGGDAFRLFGCGTKRWHLSGDWLSGRKCHFNLVAERDALRAEVERLRDSVLDYQTRCNPYVSLATQRDADQLRAEVERLKEAQRWIPVSEAHPPANKMVLVRIGRWYHLTVSCIDQFGVWRGYLPTHWMPLPELPKEVQG